MGFIHYSILTALGWESFKRMADSIGELEDAPKEEKIKRRNLKWRIKLFKSGYSLCGICVLLILYMLLQ